MIYSKRGFTLVELAIVLVIIGLIVGGVLVGRDLIRTAELRSVMTDKEKIHTAVNTFRNKYNAIPGDMRNAADLWGAAAADPNDWMCYVDINGVGPTCNGNGDKKVMSFNEAYGFWQQLANANLYNSATISGSVGQNSLPNPTWSTAHMYWVYWWGYDDGTNTELFEGHYGHFLFLSGRDSSGNRIPGISPIDMLSMDQKFDDGIITTGQMVGFKKNSSEAPNCATTDDATAEYDLSNGGEVCTVVFKNAI